MLGAHHRGDNVFQHDRSIAEVSALFLLASGDVHAPVPDDLGWTPQCLLQRTSTLDSST